MIIIFEGPDGVGKDWLYKRFTKHINYRWGCVVRLFASDYVYAKYFNREEFFSPEAYNKFWSNTLTFFRQVDSLMVFIAAPELLILRRLMAKGEVPECNPNLKTVMELYAEFFNLTHLRDNHQLLELNLVEGQPTEPIFRRIEGAVKNYLFHKQRRKYGQAKDVQIATSYGNTTFPEDGY